MSRTLKDRPEWVRTNDPREYRYEDHEHEHLGKPIYRSFAVFDENGERKQEVRTRRSYDYRVCRPDHVDAEDFGNGFFMRRVPVEETYVDYVYVTRLVGYVADHCTISEPRPAGSIYNSYRRYPCGYHLVTLYRNRPEKAYRRAHHSKARRSESNAVTKAVKLYNSGEDIEFYDDEALNTRPHRHKGWWD